MFKNYLTSFIIIIIILCIFSNIISIYIQNINNLTSNQNENISDFYFPANDSFFWPTPGYYNITSYFGNRISPTTGKASTHSGIDIGASENSYIYAVHSGYVSFTGFNGANGYSIHIQNNNFTFIYGHVSPDFKISENDFINIGEIIGNIGPKYVPYTSNNPYKDYTRKIYKWFHYWPTFTFKYKKRRQSRQSFELFIILLHIVFKISPI